MNFNVDWTLLTMSGSTFVSTTGWIKTLLEIRKLQREMAKAKETQESKIYVPQTTEERVRYGSTALPRLFTLAFACATVSLVSAAVAIPGIASRLHERQQLEQEVQKLQQSVLKPREKRVEPKQSEPNAQVNSPTPTLPPPVATPLPTAPLVASSEHSAPVVPRANVERMADIVAQFIGGGGRNAVYDRVNRLVLASIQERDYPAFSKLVYKQSKDAFTQQTLDNWHQLIFSKDETYKTSYVGSIKDYDRTHHLWMVTTSSGRFLETLIVSDRYEIIQAYFVRRLPTRE